MTSKYKRPEVGQKYKMGIKYIKNGMTIFNQGDVIELVEVHRSELVIKNERGLVRKVRKVLVEVHGKLVS